MSTTSASISSVVGVGVAKQIPEGHYGPGRVIKGEWVKLRSVRSTVWSLLIMLALTILLGLLVTSLTGSHWNRLSLADRLRFDPVSQSLVGLFLSQVALGVLGILALTAEYSSGTIRATFSAIPNRPLVLASKVLVFGVVALVVSVIATFVAFLVGQAVLSGSPAPHATLAQASSIRAIIGGALFVTVLGLFAMGLGAILRHTAGAIVVFVAILLVLPLILNAFPQSIINDVGRFLPANIGAAMVTVGYHPGQHAFAPWTGFAILCGYAVAALLIGGWVMVRRDA